MRGLKCNFCHCGVSLAALLAHSLSLSLSLDHCPCSHDVVNKKSSKHVVNAFLLQIPETRRVDSLCMWGRSWRMSYSHQKRAEKARLELICESSRKAAALHAKINGKELDKPDITQTCEEILNSSVPVALSLVDERKVVKQHLLEDVTSLRVEETNGAWRTKAIPDPTLLPQGRTYARKEAVTLLKKADFGNFDQKWQHKEKQRAGSGEGGNTGAWSEHGSKQDIGSSSTTTSSVDSKGRYVDQLGFTWIGTPKIDDESTPPGVKSTPPGVKETAIDAFVDMETLKFTSTENVFLLRPQISTILDDMGDDTVKYKLVNIKSFLIQRKNNFAKSVSIVSNFSKVYPPRRLVCGPCKQDSRNLPAGEKMPLLDLEMIRKISVYAMTPGRKAVMIISNDLYLTSTFADKLRAQYNELTVITPSVGCMIPVDMYREKTASDVRPRNVQRGARNVQRGGD
ncbi:hypothetical protein IGI04_000944 [Brassica rapa subsp. trilocularis]|uniref:PIN domain-containing protein n=1 Tax=Brassica rapa subsp. trilocularis TaxID=1813537 RepID=A0ABQ7NR93_BRACM|nr:uncharacterized protein LOC103856444 isoform X2 [Brassica rapa]KAG5413377.1 hypothetical protein IGI04_000944 [Brassica rapa subsp. trilocularis]